MPRSFNAAFAGGPRKFFIDAYVLVKLSALNHPTHCDAFAALKGIFDDSDHRGTTDAQATARLVVSW
jgi:hypothetical protein